MVTIQNIGYDGSFNQPGVTPGLQNAEFNLKGYLTAIPFLGMEGLVQLDYSVVPLIEARMNDATNVTLDRFSTDMYNNIANTQSMIGLPAAVDDGTFAATYGGLSRPNNTFWKSIYVHNGSPTTPDPQPDAPVHQPGHEGNGRDSQDGADGVWHLDQPRTGFHTE